MFGLNTFTHLLPSGRATRLNPVDKNIRKLFEGLVPDLQDICVETDLTFFDLFPDTTRNIELWEQQFGLPPVANLTEDQRRQRLIGAWRALGGQSPSYIQSVLQEHGFDVYVHEFWSDYGPPAVVRNPLDYLRPTYLQDPSGLGIGDGDTLMADGEPEAGDTFTAAQGYPLVNKIYTNSPDYLAADGNVEMADGEPDASDGQLFELAYRPRDYTIPNDPTKWPYFLYIGGEVFPSLKVLPIERREEFETLCLKICPSQQWLGILVAWQ